jgi:glycerol-3-phosphate dehydrogenase
LLVGGATTGGKRYKRRVKSLHRKDMHLVSRVQQTRAASDRLMIRNPTLLADTHFDVLVIGGGAFGAAAARAAALRGLRTALIERNDFGSGASAECFKMVHGGIRYLQHADIARARASCHERSAFLRTAPHLVKPLPIAIPTYGRGRRGKLFLRAGMLAYDFLTLDRNAGIQDGSRRIRAAQFLSREEVLTLFPHVDPKDLTGAAVFEDGQMHHPARLVFAFVQSAAEAGAIVCNYMEATGFRFEGDAIRGVEAVDRLSGDALTISADLVLNAAGPWAEHLLRDRARFREWRRGPFSRDAYFIVDRPPTSSYALAIPGLSRDQDAVLSRANRHLFLVPWRDKTLVGVWHRLFPQHPDTALIESAEIQQWMDELNVVNPALGLRMEEVRFADCGLVPFGEHADATSLQFGKESRFIDHRERHGIAGLVTVIGIRYTMARIDGERALDLLLAQRDKQPPPVDTTRLPLAGGAIDDVAALRARAQRECPADLSPASLDSLLCHHGTEYREIFARLAKDPESGRLVPGTTVLTAEIDHAVEREMAQHLDDVVLRRTDMSGHAHPGWDALRFTADRMAQKLEWTSQRKAEEIAATQGILARHHARDGSRERDRPELGSMFAKLRA